jgi:eukaryotic-like serine/threonine-protein kinase
MDDSQAKSLPSAAQSLTADWKGLISDTSQIAPESSESQTAPAVADAEECPAQIGRYVVERLLGRGAFGKVFRCHDGVLKRSVAVKVPHGHLLSAPELYLEEARVLASLEHPAIVPVYDAGQTEAGMCYVVSKFIEGSNLKVRNQQAPLSRREGVELVATIAEALHHAHVHRVVHRDVKPANILLDHELRPYLADFGLALREEDFGQHGKDAGTPVYMSPEQARSEGHLVDGRSDIFSLGVVFYELLTSARPFRGSSAAEILERIRTLEPRPPRQVDDTIPKELERICLKALSKRGADRYTTALDMSDDLRAFLAEFQDGSRRSATSSGSGDSHRSQSASTRAISALGVESEKPFKIVPKGLRSFDETDADFFLKLLPGPHDRNGLPDNILFWKSRIEKTDPEGIVRVGIIYGPSGCGKSSLVKAGLLPQLDPSVVKVYVEASGSGHPGGGSTEERLLRNLCRQFPDLVVPASKEPLGLVGAVTALRRGQGLAPGQKVLLVIDQFEQWLHGHGGEGEGELILALRQCDGIHVQCLVLVRDDFWLAVSRFMRALEIRLTEGENSRLVDLFDKRHARKVLAALGAAFGAVPESESQRSKEQNAFLDQAVDGLAEEGKVILVRLSLFAEMFKNKPWTPSALREIGGAEGVGMAFLEETFSSPTAPPHHRMLQKTAQAVLAALLPEAGSDIKGHTRSHQDLLEAAGCRDRPLEFDEAIALLDGELRLVTPSDSESLEPHTSSLATEASSRKPQYYQLTHDYLVPSLRSWLTRKQRASRQGRAEIRLADLASLWTARPEHRRLPSLLEFVQIRLFTASPRGYPAWSEGQRKMMNAAARFHALRGMAAMVVVMLIALGADRYHSWLTANELYDQLFSADIGKVLRIIDDMAKYRAWVTPRLRQEFDNSGADEGRRLRASLALLPGDPTQVEYLYGRLLTAEPHEVPVIGEALAPYKKDLLDRLWAAVEMPAKPGGRERLAAAAALVKYDPESPRWEKAGGPVAEDLVSVNPIFLGLWSEEFRPVKKSLLEPLAGVFRDRIPERTTERNLATNILADYAADQPQMLAGLVMDADDTQFGILFRKLNEHGDKGVLSFYSELDKQPPPGASQDAKEALAHRQANAAVALLKMNHAAKAWPLLKFTPDPRARSELVLHLAPLDVDLALLLRRLDEETDISSRRALIVSLGDFDARRLPDTQRQAAIAKMLDLYQTAADPGVHGAVRWLLRQKGWDQGDKLRAIDISLQVDEKQLRARRAGPAPGDPREWYVNPHGQTFVIVDARQPFTMGSPVEEPEHEGNEVQHQRTIGRRFAIAACPVTKEQFQLFQHQRPHIARMPAEEFDKIVLTADSPQIGMTWYEAAEYCNWLSEKEGIPADQWYYETNRQGAFDEGMRVRDGARHLTGYRMASEAECEYACRAGTITRFYFGESDALLVKYAWYNANSRGHTWPVASLRPNDLGLFDMLGNVWQWCDGPFTDYPQGGPADDSGVVENVTNANLGVLRGGSYDNLPGHVRAAYRLPASPSYNTKRSGFRLARTLDF